MIYNIYPNISSYIDRLKDIVIPRSKDKLQTILSKYLKVSTQNYYITKLKTLDKDLLRANLLSNQYKVLNYRFMESDLIVLNILEK